MANLIPKAIADLELQLASEISIGDTSFTLNASVDDDGVSLPAGLYCFTFDSGTSNKEYLIGQLNGVNVTSVKTVSRQGIETSGAARRHRVGAPVILTNFATLQRVADILQGDLELDGASPIAYDAEPTLANREEIATVGYVLDTVNGGTVSFDNQIVNGNAGATFSAGALVYFNTADQEWYACDADTAATVEGVQIGFANGAGSDGVAISGGVQISGTFTTSGLTAGATYYASNTAGAISSSAGTTSKVIGLALSTTKLLIIPSTPQTIKDSQKEAMAGGGDFGTPSTSNKFITEDYLGTAVSDKVTFTSSGTWTKDAGLVRVRVQAWGGGGAGWNLAGDGGGGGGGYSEKWFEASELGATETVTIGAGGIGIGGDGGNTTFGSLLTAYGGEGGSATAGGNAGGPTQAGSTGSGAMNAAGSGATGEDGIFGGAGGFGASNAGNAYWGGAGGSDTGTAGVSIHGGNGGAATVAGSQPGGGGGRSANGGAGQVIVTEYYS